MLTPTTPITVTAASPASMNQTTGRCARSAPVGTRAQLGTVPGSLRRAPGYDQGPMVTPAGTV